MKRKTFILCLLAELCGTAFVGCQKDNLSGQSHNTIITVLPGNAKTHLNPADYGVKWDQGDQISVSRGNTTTTNAFSTFTLQWPLEQNGEARFEGTITATEGMYYAIYPAQQNLSVDGDKLTCEAIRTHQTLTPVTFGRGDNTAVGYNDNTTMSFRNVGGLAKLTLHGTATVKSVRITNNAATGNILSGRGTIDLMENDGSLPIEWASSGTYSYVEAASADGIDVSTPSTYYIVLPPCTLSNYTITIKDVDDNELFNETRTTPLTISRATITNLGSFEVENIEPVPASNQIWYTAEEQITLCSNLTSELGTPTHIYDPTTKKGCLTFASTITSIPEKAFSGSDARGLATFTSVTLPASVTSIGSRAFMECHNLASVTMPGVTSIGLKAFQETTLESVTLPAITSIDDFAFAYCYSLHNVDLGSGIQTIRDDAFAFSDNALQHFYCRAASAPTISTSSYPTFDQDTSGTLHVPAGSTGYTTWSSYFTGGIEYDL